MTIPEHLPSEGFAGRIAAGFITSKLTPLLVIASILLGLMATLLLPREEEPQIKVPMIDIMVSMPGTSSSEMEQRVTNPMEKLLWEIDGVEYVYSTSMPGQSLVIVRFEVGRDSEKSQILLNSKLEANYDIIPPGASMPLIKPHSIDDVPIMALTLHSSEYDHTHLRSLASELEQGIKQIPDVSETTIIGGYRRAVHVELDTTRLTARHIAAGQVVSALESANTQFHAGTLINNNNSISVETGGFFRTQEDVAATVVGVFEDNPIYLRDVATVIDSAEDPSTYVFHGRGAASANRSDEQAAVTISIAKRPGTNAITVANAISEKVTYLQPRLFPKSVGITTTRNYGDSAAEKSNELLFHMGIAIVSVSILIMLMLGWRESLIVLVAIPTTLSLTLLVFYLYGYTLNRITLFALIFSIGILVDDAIVVIENIVRHRHLPENKNKPLRTIAVEATAEVGNPTILATWAVIAAILPMAGVGGLMGPYMRPIPVGASAAMFFSLIVAFIVTPWAALKVMGRHSLSASTHVSEDEKTDDFFTRLYRVFMGTLLNKGLARWAFLGGITALLLGAMALVPAGLVQVKMLPFDNKSEFQVIVNMPEGSSLEQTARATREMAAALRHEPEVEHYQAYIGTASPFNFNGLVRHYFLRSGAPSADIQVNLLPKHARTAQSHDIAKRVRPALAEIAKRYGASIAVAEVPPGPPVLQTLVAEVYGPTQEDRIALAREVKTIFETTDGVVDSDWYVEAPQPQRRFLPDSEKAALHGITTEHINESIALLAHGQIAGLLHVDHTREDIPITVRLPQESRTTIDDVLNITLTSSTGDHIPLRELVRVVEEYGETAIYHKNLLPVTYVTADVAGAIEAPVYAIGSMNERLATLDGTTFGGTEKDITIYNGAMPTQDYKPAIKWDGEWHITIEVFRDLGLAFAGVLVLIYLLMVGWFKSFITPLIVMVAIPFSLVGILPAHTGMGAFFSATSMIGFMAGAGIVVRNSIILIDFIELRIKHGDALSKAVVDAGAVRFRPMLLTALAVVVGASVILFDPIFQGLAISLMAGEIASLFISRMAIPVLYYMVNKKNTQKNVES